MAISFASMNHITTKQIAESIGVTPCRVLQLASSRGIKPTRIGSAYVWPREVLSKFKRRSPGRPVQKGKR
jgi:hypothetical protein